MHIVRSLTRPKMMISALVVALLALVVVPAPAIAAPANDDFANAQVIAPEGGTKTGTNEDSTVEAGEPNHAASVYGEAFHSIWYSWTAPADGPATFSTCGSEFDTRVGVYTGSSVGALTTVASNDNSTAGSCPGKAFAEVAWTAIEGTTYRIAVDTNGGVDANGQPQQNDTTTGLVQVVLDGPDVEEPEDPDTTPGTAVDEAPYKLTVPDFRPKCKGSKETPEKCKQGTLKFKVLGKVRAWVRAVQAEGADVTLVESGKNSGTQDGQVLKWLRSPKARGGEVLAQNVKPGTTFFTTVEDTLRLKVDFFDPSIDKAIQADTLDALKEDGEDNKNVRSPCKYIDTNATPTEILVELNQLVGAPYITEARLAQMLARVGCGYEATYFDAPGMPVDFVDDVTGVDRQRHLIKVRIGLPVRQDFLLVVREDPQFATTSMLGLGTDGKLTASSSQMSRMTVQVVERLTGRLVSGAQVTFIGSDGKPETQRTNADGEWTFTSKLPKAATYSISARVTGANGALMAGFRSIQVVQRSGSFVTMSGREMTLANGAWTGTQEDLDRAKSLQVVPANLGTGLCGAPSAPPSIVQSTAVTTAPSGFVAGEHNAVSVPDDTNFAVGAAPGLLTLGGGLPEGAARDYAEAWPNPFAGIATFVNAIVTGLKRTFDQGANGPGTAYEKVVPADRTKIADSAAFLAANGAGVPPNGLISDKGLGVISTGGLNVIATGGLNVIATGGLNLRDAQGNLIGQAGGNIIASDGASLIGQAGGNVIATGGLNMMPVYGGKVIATGGPN